jgi:hypothetical protein
MSGKEKFVAVLASIAVFMLPAATMPLQCLLMGPPKGEHCHHHVMVTENAPEKQLNPVSYNRLCCDVSAKTAESITLPPLPAGERIVITPIRNTLRSDLLTLTVHKGHDCALVLPGGPPQAVLCTFLI